MDGIYILHNFSGFVHWDPGDGEEEWGKTAFCETGLFKLLMKYSSIKDCN